MNYSKLIVIFLITCQSTKCLGQVFEDENMPGHIQTIENIIRFYEPDIPLLESLIFDGGELLPLYSSEFTSLQSEDFNNHSSDFFDIYEATYIKHINFCSSLENELKSNESEKCIDILKKIKYNLILFNLLNDIVINNYFVNKLHVTDSGFVASISIPLAMPSQSRNIHINKKQSYNGHVVENRNNLFYELVYIGNGSNLESITLNQLELINKELIGHSENTTYQPTAIINGEFQYGIKTSRSSVYDYTYRLYKESAITFDELGLVGEILLGDEKLILNEEIPIAYSLGDGNVSYEFNEYGFLEGDQSNSLLDYSFSGQTMVFDKLKIYSLKNNILLNPILMTNYSFEDNSRLSSLVENSQDIDYYVSKVKYCDDIFRLRKINFPIIDYRLLINHCYGGNYKVFFATWDRPYSYGRFLSGTSPTSSRFRKYNDFCNMTNSDYPDIRRFEDTYDYKIGEIMRLLNKGLTLDKIKTKADQDDWPVHTESCVLGTLEILAYESVLVNENRILITVNISGDKFRYGEDAWVQEVKVLILDYNIKNNKSFYYYFERTSGDWAEDNFATLVYDEHEKCFIGNLLDEYGAVTYNAAKVRFTVEELDVLFLDKLKNPSTQNEFNQEDYGAVFTGGGCKDERYLEYDSKALFNVSSYCKTIIIEGCTNDAYIEYNPKANVSDDSCDKLIVMGCMDNKYMEYNPIANRSDMSCKNFTPKHIAYLMRDDSLAIRHSGFNFGLSRILIVPSDDQFFKYPRQNSETVIKVLDKLHNQLEKSFSNNNLIEDEDFLKIFQNSEDSCVIDIAFTHSRKTEEINYFIYLQQMFPELINEISQEQDVKRFLNENSGLMVYNYLSKNQFSLTFKINMKTLMFHQQEAYLMMLDKLINEEFNSDLNRIYKRLESGKKISERQESIFSLQEFISRKLIHLSKNNPIVMQIK